MSSARIDPAAEARPAAAAVPVQRVSRMAVFTTSLALTMAVLDSSIANLALPSIARDLAVSASDVVWVVNAYQLSILILLLPFGSLGEILGYKTVYRFGLLLFTLASIGCAFAPTLAWLAIARAVQGVGAAGIMSVNSGLLRFIYPPSKLGQGIGINGMVVALSSAVGPSIAAGLLAIGPWPLLFLVNIPLGLTAFFLGAKTLPISPHSGQRFDFASAGLSAVLFALGVASIDVGGRGAAGWLVALMVGGAAGAALLLVRRQRDRKAPLLPVDLLRIPLFRLSIMSSICAFSGMTLAMVALPFLLERGHGFSTSVTGLLITAWPVPLAIAAPLAGRLSDRHSAGLLGSIGMAMLCVGLIAVATMPATAGAVGIALRLAMCGFGFGLFQTPNNRAMITSAPKERSGGAGGMLATARLLGNAAGAAGAAVALAAGQRGPMLAVSAGAVLAAVAAGVSATRIGRT
ncbi:MAG TPA: MFS transporter [Acetobacteraceae bacterium]|nr:MFS transporter [Acetobacteraceae bacterium]